MKKINSIEALVEAIKVALTINSFSSATEGMTIVEDVLAKTNCRTIENATKFCELFGVEYGDFTCEHIIDREVNPFSAKGYTLILSALSLCNDRYYIGVLTKEDNRKDRARTANNY